MSMWRHQIWRHQLTIGRIFHAWNDKDRNSSVREKFGGKRSKVSVLRRTYKLNSRAKFAALQEKSYCSSGNQQQKSNVFRVLTELRDGIRGSRKSGWVVHLSKRLFQLSLHNLYWKLLPEDSHWSKLLNCSTQLFVVETAVVVFKTFWRHLSSFYDDISSKGVVKFSWFETTLREFL